MLGIAGMHGSETGQAPKDLFFHLGYVVVKRRDGYVRQGTSIACRRHTLFRHQRPEVDPFSVPRFAGECPLDALRRQRRAVGLQ